MVGKNSVLRVLDNLSNPIRKGVVEALSQRGQATFSELLVLCRLDTYYQKGLLDYHLKELHKSRIVTKKETVYVLTRTGKTVARFLQSLEREYQRLFITEELNKGGEIVQLKIAEFEHKDAEAVSLTRYGSKEGMKSERPWACGNKVPLKLMSEWGETFSLIARSSGNVIGVLYGNTTPMHVVDKEGGEKLEIVQPTENKPANRLDGEIFEIWIHPNYEGQGVEKQLIKEFVDRMREQGAVNVIAERVLSENDTLLEAFKELGFQKIASYRDFRVEI